MVDLFAKYSTSEIVIFVVLLALAVEELVQFIDWAKERARKSFDKDAKDSEQHKELEEKIEELSAFYEEKEKVDTAFEKIDETFKKINESIDMLIESDKEDIKSYITEKHHLFVYDRGWIDDYSLECLERRFAVYRQEHGNSFVEGLMNELRALPKQPPAGDELKYESTARYVSASSKKH